MPYDEHLAERVRDMVADVPGIAERKMFGGLCFMVNGNMACGPVHDTIMVRVGPDAYETALAEPDAIELQFTGKPMTGMVELTSDALADDVRLREWVDRGVTFASSLPPK
jgi:TfoX/Sxy family transcriptional regulator of competence genes